MKPYLKTILLPTDFSEFARNAIAYAINLLDNNEVNFYLLNAYTEPRSGASMIISIDDILQENSREGLDAELSWIKQQFPRLKSHISIHSIHGSLPEVIAQLETQHDFDLIVMGTQGASGLREVLMGSTASSVIRNSNTPVIAVPHNVVFHQPANMVFAADFEHMPDLQALDPFKMLAMQIGAHIKVLNIEKANSAPYCNKQEVEQRLRAYLYPVPHTYHYIVNSHVARDIDDFVHQENADMLLMVTRKRSFMDRIWHKSITQKLAFHTDVPLFALHQ